MKLTGKDPVSGERLDLTAVLPPSFCEFSRQWYPPVKEIDTFDSSVPMTPRGKSRGVPSLGSPHDSPHLFRRASPRKGSRHRDRGRGEKV